MISKNSKIYVAGHNGLVGSAIVRSLKKKGYKNILTASRKKLDLTNQKKVNSFLKKNKPKFIFIAAAKVGGIYSNNRYKADFIFKPLDHINGSDANLSRRIPIVISDILGWYSIFCKGFPISH